MDVRDGHSPTRQASLVGPHLLERRAGCTIEVSTAHNPANLAPFSNASPQLWLETVVRFAVLRVVCGRPVQSKVGTSCGHGCVKAPIRSVECIKAMSIEVVHVESVKLRHVEPSHFTTAFSATSDLIDGEQSLKRSSDGFS